MTTESPGVARHQLAIYPEDHIQGAVYAAYTLVAYVDYECPACRRLYETICNLQKALGDRLRIIYRHYPLSGIHPQAQEAAEAAEAAGAQGRFWEMHYLLFRNQNALTRKNLLSYAVELGLDIGRFRNDLENRAYRERVREHFRRGVQDGCYKPPALFMNGVRRDEIFGFRWAS